jgi:hypothetical protein
VKSYVITLTSQQSLGAPELLNHYIFVDPIEGVNFTYPLTTNGGVFTPYNFTNYVSGGQFYPWGYKFQTVYQYLSAPYLKGPHTITFASTALDTTYYGILKIAYDFGDGETLVQERDVVPNNSETGIATLDPSQVLISHTYWPKNNSVTTYYPSITVLNGNLALNVFYIDIKIFPSSVYDLGNVRLLNTVQHSESLNETAAIFEISKPTRFVTNARFFSGGVTEYNQENLSMNFEDSDLILNLDAADPFTIVKTPLNQVSVWKDKSGYNNDFAQSTKPLRPMFLYNTQTDTGRKAVRFDTVSQILTCVNQTGFSPITGGYTMFFVMRTNMPGGSIFSISDELLPGLTNTEISQVLVYKKALSTDTVQLVKNKLKYKWGIT